MTEDLIKYANHYYNHQNDFASKNTLEKIYSRDKNLNSGPQLSQGYDFNFLSHFSLFIHISNFFKFTV